MMHESFNFRFLKNMDDAVVERGMKNPCGCAEMAEVHGCLREILFK